MRLVLLGVAALLGGTGCSGPLVIREAPPLTELPADSPAREIHEFTASPAEVVAAASAALEGMQYRIESTNAEFGLIAARGGLVVYDPTLVAAGQIVINGAIITAGVLAGAHAVPGVELESQHEFRIFVQIWGDPAARATRVRAIFVRSTLGGSGSRSRNIEGSSEQYAAFFTILEQQLHPKAPERMP